MYKYSISVLWFIVIIIWGQSSLYSGTYYVSASATGGGDGSFNNEFTIQEAFAGAVAGDTVYIKPGTYSVDNLTVANDGTNDTTGRIVFTAYDSENKPVINNIGTNYTIRARGSYITLKDLIVNNTTATGYVISFGGNAARIGRNIILDGLEVTTWSGGADVIHGDNTYGLIIRNCIIDGGGTNRNGIDIHSLWNEPADTLNYFNRSNNMLIENNIIKNAPGHHGVNIFNNAAFSNPEVWAIAPIIDTAIIRNNYMENVLAMFYVRYVRWYQMYNNVGYNVLTGLSYNTQGGFPDAPQDTISSYSIFANNTVVMTNTIPNDQGFAIWNSTANNLTVKNNIFYGLFYTDKSISFFQENASEGCPTVGHDIDNNLYYNTQANSYQFKWCPTLYSTFSAYRSATGQDSNSMVNDNPDFVNPVSDWHLQAGSPAIDAGQDLSGYFTTDYDGNTRTGTWDIGAYEYVPRGPDITPPEVTGAILLDSVTLVVNFSEALDETTAEDENNYSITNNINVFNASLSGSKVTLQTTTHTPGSYTVTVVNVEDLAGNPISQSNTAEYSLIPPDSLIMLPIVDVQGVIQELGHTPLKTIDGLGALSGDPDSRWAAEPMPEELIFDLGSNRIVCKTKLSFYRWNYGRVYTYSILTSSDNNNWATIVSQATSALQEQWTVDKFPAVDARYVKILFINNSESDWAGLWEGEIWGIISTVVNPANNGLPDEFSLYQNYPNPFNPSTTISYSIAESSFVTLKVYDVLGNEIATLVNAEKPVGSYEVNFDATGLPSGIYFYRLQANEFAQVKKMILLK